MNESNYRPKIGSLLHTIMTENWVLISRFWKLVMKFGNRAQIQLQFTITIRQSPLTKN